MRNNLLSWCIASSKGALLSRRTISTAPSATPFSSHYIHDNYVINYYEIGKGPALLMIHGQGVDARSFAKVAKRLAKTYHVYLVDCYGHGGSVHEPSKYNLRAQGDDLIRFIREVIGEKTVALGHSSGGLIASYIAAEAPELVEKLFLEDPPLFSSCGEERKKYYNYKDLATVCHEFLRQKKVKDFVYYYFVHQYCWNYFPEESREKLRAKLGAAALKYRQKYPERDLKVPFWPKKFLEGFKGLNRYDPRFGEAFYDDSFNAGVDYEKLLAKIKCDVVFMKAKTAVDEDGVVQGALTEEDLAKVLGLVPQMKVVRFETGHGIHAEKPREFVGVVEGRHEF